MTTHIIRHKRTPMHTVYVVYLSYALRPCYVRTAEAGRSRRQNCPVSTPAGERADGRGIARTTVQYRLAWGALRHSRPTHDVLRMCCCWGWPVLAGPCDEKGWVRVPRPLPMMDTIKATFFYEKEKRFLIIKLLIVIQDLNRHYWHIFVNILQLVLYIPFQTPRNRTEFVSLGGDLCISQVWPDHLFSRIIIKIYLSWICWAGQWYLHPISPAFRSVSFLKINWQENPLPSLLSLIRFIQFHLKLVYSVGIYCFLFALLVVVVPIMEEHMLLKTLAMIMIIYFQAGNAW